ncbi:hypothetical protein QAD02_022884 [Eretmocerus hayati]|uniref:Uncharacterized protein n=1 Tax=Eretmocerus hayati TaxID=131215 RepID=A0ACC2PZ58_9HYME|nr:hypothetical protein QAD02_022884 [Eretmocerus hayati]
MNLCTSVIIVATSLTIVSSAARKMNTIFQWRYIDFTWPSRAVKQEAIRTGAYNYSEVIPMDIDVSHDGRIFLSLVNHPGNPVRLGTLTKRMEYSGPLIQPYPSWEWTNRNDCDAIIEIWKITIDECNRLWVVDTGRDHKLSILCPAKLLAFDLSSNRVVKKLIIPESIAVNDFTKQSIMTTIKVETSGPSCKSTTTIVAQDHERLRFVVGFKTMQSPMVNEEELWVLTNRFPEFLQNRLDFSKFNYYVLQARVRDLIRGTKCELPHSVASAKGHFSGRCQSNRRPNLFDPFSMAGC